MRDEVDVEDCCQNRRQNFDPCHQEPSVSDFEPIDGRQVSLCCVMQPIR